MDEKTVWSTISGIFAEYALKIAASLLILILGSMLIRFIINRIGDGRWLKKLDTRNRQYLRTFLKFLLNALLVMVIIAVLGIPIASILTVLAAVGATIALALQGSLANVASGIVLLVTHPFRIDDFIQIGDKSGRVTDQGLFYTTIRTLENLDIAIPNSHLTTAVITNMSMQQTRRTNLTLSVAYGTDPAKVRELILGYADNHPKILKDPAPFCAMSAMSQSSIDFIVRFWMKKEDYWDTWFAMQEDLYNLLYENDIKIPFNQLDVHIKND